jgi:hypothetical protein
VIYVNPLQEHVKLSSKQILTFRVYSDHRIDKRCMTKFETDIPQKSQTGLMTQVISLYQQIVSLRQRGRIISQQQNQVREYLKKLS